jgi:hypothetical protein
VPSFQAVATWPDGDKFTLIREGRSEQEVALAIEAESLPGGDDFDLSIHPVKRADQIKPGEIVHLDGSDWHVSAVRVMPGTVRLVLAPRYAPTLTRDTMVQLVQR